MPPSPILFAFLSFCLPLSAMDMVLRTTCTSEGRCGVQYVPPAESTSAVLQPSQLLAMPLKSRDLAALESVLAKNSDLRELSNHYTVHIPAHITISAADIHNFMQELGYNVIDRWNSILDPIEIIQKQLTERFLMEVEKIGDEIRGFSEKLEKNGETKVLAHVMKFMEHLSLETIIRVTHESYEDPQHLLTLLDNRMAGLVLVQKAALFREIINKIAQCFTRFSIIQRSHNNDPHLFDVPPCALLIQEYPGIMRLGYYTLACRASSQELQGPTPGLSLTQCTFGVVDQMVSARTHYTQNNHTESIHFINFAREFSATDSGKISMKSELKGSPPAYLTLSQKDHTSIHYLLTKLEELYERPVLVDLVIDPRDKKVYILQIEAQEILSEHDVPNYVEECTLGCTPEQEMMKVKIADVQEVICAGGSKVLLILNKDEILITKTIEQALHQFNSQLPHKNAVQAIAVKQWSGPLSHATMRFTKLGKPVIYLGQEAMSTLELAVTAGYPVLLDLQQRHIIRLPYRLPEHINIAHLTKKDIIKDKRLDHPLAAVVSIEPTMAAEAHIETYASMHDPYENQTTNEVLEIIKEAPLEDAHSAVTSIFTRLAKTIREKRAEMVKREAAIFQLDGVWTRFKNFFTHYMFEPPYILKSDIEKLSALFNHAFKLAPVLRDSLSLESRHITRLANVRFLEAVLFQKNEPWCGCFSFESVLGHFNAKAVFIEKMIELIKAKKISTVLIDPSNRDYLFKAFVGTQIVTGNEDVEEWLLWVDKFAQKMLAGEQISQTEAIQRYRDERYPALWKRVDWAAIYFR